MALTYEPIASTTLSVNTTNVNFSSLPTSYTDLRVISTFLTATAGVVPQLRLNNSSGGTEYNLVYINASGATAPGSAPSVNQPQWNIDPVIGASTTIPNTMMIEVFEYNGTTNKAIHAQMGMERNTTQGGQVAIVGMRANTAAVTSLNFTVSGSGQFAPGSVFTLYGIKRA